MDLREKRFSVRANGLMLAGIEIGQGPLVLCLHGFPDTPLGYRDLMRRLALEGYRVAAPYQRGYSPSQSPTDDDYRPGALGADALGVIQALGEDSAIVIGHDWGAVAAYAAAALDHNRISKLVTLAVPHARGTRPTPAWLAIVALFQATPIAVPLLKAGGGMVIDMVYRLASPGWNFTDEDTAPVKAVTQAPGGAEGIVGVYRSLRRAILGGGRDPGLKLLLQKIRVPTLAIGGLDDAAFPRGGFDRMPKAMAARLEVELYPEVGHFPHRERPAEVAQRILKFIGPAKARGKRAAAG